MITGFHSKNKTWYFQKEKCRELYGEVTNPGRGWYQIYPFVLGEEISWKEMEYCLQEEERLALVLLDIGNYRSKPIPQEALEQIPLIFQFFICHKKEIILRVVYDREGKGMEREPLRFGRILEHMSQVGPLIGEYASWIFVVQGLFVGSWGEMHTSRYLTPAHIRQLYSRLDRAIGGSCMIAVRTPRQWRMIVKKEEIINAKKVPAFFNDGMFGSSTHLGTFGVKKEKDWEKPWLLEEELKFIDRYMNLAPNGGEAVYRASVSQSQVIHTLENMHICYLNSSYDRKILEKWKNMESRKFPGHSLYEEISQRLGYRFVVRKVKARNHPSSGNVLYLDIDIENTGFGSFQGKGRLELVIEDRKGGRVSFPIKADPRQWKSGAFIRVTAGILWKPKLLDQTQGQYPCYLYLYDQMTKQEIAFANEKKGQKLCLGMILDYI